METINERLAITNDEKIAIEFPEIKNDEFPLLMIYEASEELHAAGLRAKIVTFLYDNKAIEMESFINTSIHFKMKAPYSIKTLTKLNTDFESFITPFEREKRGKVYWIFNYLVKFTPKDKPEQIGMIGKGNKSFNDRFQEKLLIFINKLLLRHRP